MKNKKIVAYLPDSIYLNSWMTVEQIIDYFADFYEDFSKCKKIELTSGNISDVLDTTWSLVKETADTEKTSADKVGKK